MKAQISTSNSDFTEARIAEKLVFNRLSYDVQMEIARFHIARELSFLRDKGFHLTASKELVAFVMQRDFHPRLGARPLRDAIGIELLIEVGLPMLQTLAIEQVELAHTHPVSVGELVRSGHAGF